MILVDFDMPKNCRKCPIMGCIYHSVNDTRPDLCPIVREVKRGKWIDRDVYKRFKDEWQTAKCSECGLYHTTPYMYSFEIFPYCPNCGAYMLEDANET